MKTEKQLIEMSARNLGIPVEQIYAEIEETIKRCQKEEEEFQKIQHEEYIKCCQKHGWKIYPKYWTDEYRKKCSERMKLYWQQRKNQSK